MKLANKIMGAIARKGVIPLLVFTLGSSGSASGAVIHTAAFSGHTYHLLDTDGTKWWDECEAEAVDLGGHLVTINSAAENQWVLDTFGPVAVDYANAHDLPDKENISLWIGLSDATNEGTWVWVSGQPVTYTNWESGQPQGDFPDEDFAGMFVNPGTWHDIIGDTRLVDLPFCVVEISAAAPQPKRYVDHTSLPDTNNNGIPEIAVLRRLPNGHSQVVIKDTTGQVVRVIRFFGPNWDPKSVSSLDSNSDGIPNISVLAVNEETGRVAIQIRNAATGQLIKTLGFAR
jgi:hypothetical protein